MPLNNVKIGWCLDASEYLSIYEEPKRLIPPKDNSINKKGYLSCPAVRAFCENTFYVTSPFSLKIQFQDFGDRFELRPVYPFTSIDEKKFQELVTVEHPSTWRDNSLLTMQIPSPYVFFSDEDVSMEQSHCVLLNQSKINWRIIPGKFNIYAWQRPLNWAFEWDVTMGDFEIKSGEPIYSIKFLSNKKANCEYKLIKFDLNEKLTERLKLTRNITSVKKGLNPLIQKSKNERSKIKLLK